MTADAAPSDSSPDPVRGRAATAPTAPTAKAPTATAPTATPSGNGNGHGSGTGSGTQGRAPASKPGRGAGKKNRWTPHAEQVLRTRWENGDPTEDIAAELGRTPASVRERARRLQLCRRKRYRKDQPDDDPRAPRIRPAQHRREQPPQPAASDPDTAAAERTGSVTAFQPAAPKRSTRSVRAAAARRKEPARSEAPPITDLSNHRVHRPELTLSTVINFVRSRDYSVVQAESGEIVVDGRRRMTRDDFVEWANRLRRQLRKPEFPSELLQAS